MAQARGGNALLRFRGRQKRLLGVLRGRGNPVAREFELVLDGENVGGPHMSMDQGLAMEEREGLQGGSENVARFRGSERAPFSLPPWRPSRSSMARPRSMDMCGP